MSSKSAKAAKADKSSFKNRFEAIVKTLRAHPRVEVYAVEVAPPATEKAIAAAEKAVGRKLPDEMRAFYLAHDGVFLEWGLKDKEYEAKTPPFGYPDYGQPPGCINIVSVAEMLSREWAETSHVNEIDDDHLGLLFGEQSGGSGGDDEESESESGVRAVCVDNFSKYNHADMIFGPEGVMVVSTDHGADMDSSDFCSFSVYLEMTLALYGLDRYEHGIGIGWTRKSQRVSEWTKKPTLDELITKLEADGDEEDGGEEGESDE